MLQKLSSTQKKIFLIIASILGVALIAAAIAWGLHMTMGDSNTPESNTDSQLSERQEQANKTRDEGIKALEANDTDKALEHFQTAREEYLSAQEGTEYTEDNPSPEVADMDAQIEMLENLPPAPEDTPVLSPEELPVTE